MSSFSCTVRRCSASVFSNNDASCTAFDTRPEFELEAARRVVSHARVRVAGEKAVEHRTAIQAIIMADANRFMIV